MAFLILNELKDMIKMLGGDPNSVKDIGIAVVTLKKLLTEKFGRTEKFERPQFQSRPNDHRRERRTDSTEE